MIQRHYIPNKSPVKLNIPTVFKIDTRITNSNTSDDKTIIIPFDREFEGTVDWGDGIVETMSIIGSGTLNHVYSVPGEYQLSIKVNENKLFYFKLAGSVEGIKYKSIIHWGSNLVLLSQAFWKATNLDLSESLGRPIIGGNLDTLFRQCGTPSIKGLESWDLSKSSSLTSAFAEMPNFNQDFTTEVQSILSLDNLFFSTPYNRDLSELKFNKNVRLNNIVGASFSPTNYSKLLSRLRDIMVGSGRTASKILIAQCKYDDNGIEPRNQLIADGWDIQDLGLI